VNNKTVKVPAPADAQPTCVKFGNIMKELATPENRAALEASATKTVFDLTTLSNCALLIIAHFMYRDFAPDRELLIAANGELGRRGFDCDGWTISTEIGNIDDDTHQRLVDYFSEFDLQHEFFEDVLDVDDPHLDDTEAT